MDPMIPVFQPESPDALAIFYLFIKVLLISAGIFIVVSGMVIVAILRGRKRHDLPKQEYGSHRREIAWMVGPVLIVFWILAISANLILAMNAVPKAHPPRDVDADAELRIVGHQWWWEVFYNGTEIVGANEIHIPINQRIRIQLESADVIHCFWVPQLARKMDVIPGRDNYIWLEASHAGVYQGRCAEYCGNQHAWMNFKVYAHAPEQYQRWLAGEDISPKRPTETGAMAGEQEFFSRTCSNCHAIQGTAAVGTIGPDLTRIANRKEIGGGVLENSTENLQRWLKDPQEFKPGCNMPNFNLSDRQVRNLVAYLESFH